jgi:signal-transduction protein with cAMP-binding, CBS, and nucleotidyltransferase domain
VTSRRIRHIPVVERGNLIGIVTSGDIMARESREHEVTIESLVEYIGGAAPLQPL